MIDLLACKRCTCNSAFKCSDVESVIVDHFVLLVNDNLDFTWSAQIVAKYNCCGIDRDFVHECEVEIRNEKQLMEKLFKNAVFDKRMRIDISNEYNDLILENCCVKKQCPMYEVHFVNELN